MPLQIVKSNQLSNVVVATAKYFFIYKNFAIQQKQPKIIVKRCLLTSTKL